MMFATSDGSLMTSGNGSISMGETKPLRESVVFTILRDSSWLMSFKIEMLHPENPCLLAEFKCWYIATGFESGRFAEAVV